MVGGYYGGMRMNYDVFLMNLLLMVGRVCHVDEPLYYYNIRPDSLSRSNETGNKSEERKQVRQKLAQLYETAYASYQGFALGRITAAEMLTTLRAQGAHHITPEAKAALAREALQLSEILRSMLGQGVPTG